MKKRAIQRLIYNDNYVINERDFQELIENETNETVFWLKKDEDLNDK
jgi:hypothetical protein